MTWARSVPRKGVSRLVPRKDYPIVGNAKYYKKEVYKKEMSAFINNFPLGLQTLTNQLSSSPAMGHHIKFIRPAFSELLPSKCGKYSLGERVKF